MKLKTNKVLTSVTKTLTVQEEDTAGIISVKEEVFALKILLMFKSIKQLEIVRCMQ